VFTQAQKFFAQTEYIDGSEPEDVLDITAGLI
jgi:hypothetical protein